MPKKAPPAGKLDGTPVRREPPAEAVAGERTELEPAGSATVAGAAPRLKTQHDALAAVLAHEGEHVLRCIEEGDRAVAQRRMGAAEGEEAPVVGEHRPADRPPARLTALAMCSAGTGSQGLAGGEAAVAARSIPRPSACGSRRGP